MQRAFAHSRAGELMRAHVDVPAWTPRWLWCFLWGLYCHLCHPTLTQQSHLKTSVPREGPCALNFEIHNFAPEAKEPGVNQGPMIHLNSLE